MKSKSLLLISALILAASSISAGTPVASILLTDPATSNKITFINATDPNNEAYTVQTTKDGIQCRQITASGKYAYFNVDDATVPSTQNNLLVYITFFDEGTGNINFQYNGINSVNYVSSSVTKTGTNAWITATVALTNASFRNAQNNGCDFRISGAGTCIKEISIALGTLIPANEPVPTVTASSYSEFTGKSIVGYQLWFKTGDATSGWVHWSGGKAPAAGTCNFEVYPDVTEYAEADLAQTAMANLGNGSPSKLFNSTNQNVIDVHFRWMKEYGIECAAIQRFVNGIKPTIVNSPQSASLKIKKAAEANGRNFYICYDISGGDPLTWTDVLKFDWVYNVEQNNQLLSSPAYAKVGNKPVVQIWGVGVNDRPGTSAQAIEMVNFFKSRGCYVVLGTSIAWRTNPIRGTDDFTTAFASFDMISPWLTGSFRDIAGIDGRYSMISADKAYCDSRNIQYLPVVMPGFAWSQWNNGDVNWASRLAGEFMWHQVTNIKSLGINSMYIGMFDEYDEGTAIMKNATDWSMIPTDQYFLTSSADGIWCSSDFQLRVAGACVGMLKGTRTVTPNVSIPYSLGPVYYRNSFEKRTTVYNYVNDIATKTGTFNLDPCFYQNAVVLQSSVLSPVCEIQTANPRSGLYAVKASGTIGTASSAKYTYKIATTKIAVKPNMTLSFWKLTENELGRYVFVDLRTKKGLYLKNVGVDQNNASMNPTTAHGTVGAGWEKFSCNFGSGVLLGDTIIEIQVNFDKTVALTGAYTVYFDDFLIEEPANPNAVTAISDDNVFSLSQDNTNNTITINSKEADKYSIQVFTTSGLQVTNIKSAVLNHTIDLSSYSSGVYFMRLITKNKTFSQKIIINSKQ